MRQTLQTLFILTLAAAPAFAGSKATAPATTTATETVKWSNGVAYTYDGSGNIAAAGDDKFVYDDVGRIVRAHVNGADRFFGYDQFGNRTKCTQDGGGTDCQYYSANPLDNRLIGADYDDSGNMTKLGTHNYVFDLDNMMIRTDDGGSAVREFVYTVDDERLAVYEPAAHSWRWSLRDAAGKVLREFTSRDGANLGTDDLKWAKDYVWRDGLLLATKQPVGTATTTHHYHLDHLGTPRRITNDTDAIVGFHDYYPFGGEIFGGLDEPATTRMKFTGHERDEENAQFTLDYMHARFYNAALGRFSSTDPVLDAGRTTRSPQMWNRYVYAANDPVVLTDPTGTDIYIVTWATQNSHGDSDFKRAAETRADEIKAGKFYDPKYDTVLGVGGVHTKQDFANLLASAKALESKYGKVQELSFFSHSTADKGPYLHDAAGHGVQFTPTELTKMKVNWGPDAFARFYGCNSGAHFSKAFATAQKVTAFGQPGYAYFSGSPLERTPVTVNGPVYLISAPGFHNPGPMGFGWLDFATGFTPRDTMVESHP